MDLGAQFDKHKDQISDKVNETADKVIDDKVANESAAQKAKDAVAGGIDKAMDVIDSKLGGNK